MADSDKIKLASNTSQKDMEINRTLDQHFAEATEYINRNRQNLEEYEDAYEGRQRKRATKRPIENIIFQLIESEVPILTDAQLNPDIIPLEEQHMQVAEVLNAAVKSELRYNNQIIKWSQAVRNGLKTGTGWFYVDWDPDLDQGLGHVVVRVLDWRCVFIDPLATDIDDADFVGLRFPMRLDQVKRRFPEKAELLDAQSGMAKASDRIGSDANDAEREKQWTGFLSGDVQKVNKFDIVKDTVTLEEGWVRDYSLESIPEEDTAEEVEKENEKFKELEAVEARKWEDHAKHILGHIELLEALTLERKLSAAEELGVDPEQLTDEMVEELKNSNPEMMTLFETLDVQIAIIEDHIETHNIWGEQNPDSKRPKYPNNWRLAIRVGSVILYDGKPPVEDGLVPLVPVYGYKNSESVYGTGEIQNILHQQKILNEMSYAELQGLRLNSNSGWVMDENSGVDAAELTNEQGIVISKKQGTEVARLQPGQVSPQFQVKMQDARRAANDIVGLQDASQGRRPAGIVSGEAVDSLKESNLTRIREKSRILEGYSTVRLGALVASRIVKYWSNSRKLLVHDQNGELQRFDFEPEHVEDLQYDVIAVPGSTAGMDKDLIFSKAFQMLKIGIIDPVTFVEMVDLPFKASVLKKVKENNDKDAMIQQLGAENAELKALLEEMDAAIAEEEKREQPQQNGPRQIAQA